MVGLHLSHRGERPNEEGYFECLGGGNADDTEHRAVIGLALLPSPPSLAPLLLLLLPVSA